MLRKSDVAGVVEQEARELLVEAFVEVEELSPDDNLVELGFNSLMLARLVALLETSIGVDPFAEHAVISDVHTIGDLVRVYSDAL
jgi:acyl carrier protein